MNKEMTSSELKSHIIAFLREHKGGSLATCMNDIPRSSPVQYFLGEDMNIYVLSAGGDKFKAIEENPNICLLVNTEYIDYRKIKGVQVFGKATTSIKDGRILEEVKKYCQEDVLQKNKLKAIKIEPKEIVYLNSIEGGDRRKQILKNNEVILKKDEIIPIH